MKPAEALKIVGDYGITIGTVGPSPGTLADASRLPCEKAKIRMALLACITSPAREPYLSHMRAAYLQLADFQLGIGPVNLSEQEAIDRGLGLAVSLARSDREKFWLDLAPWGALDREPPPQAAP